MKKLLLIALVGLFVSTTGWGHRGWRSIKDIETMTLNDGAKFLFAHSSDQKSIFIAYKYEYSQPDGVIIEKEISKYISFNKEYWNSVEAMDKEIREIRPEHADRFIKEWVEPRSKKIDAPRTTDRFGYTIAKYLCIAAITGASVYGAIRMCQEYQKLQSNAFTAFIKASGALLNNTKALIKSGIDKFNSGKQVTA